MEGDRSEACGRASHGYFNPLPPHGGRPLVQFVKNATCQFQSTPSAWRETDTLVITPRNSDYFNPLPPHGGRPDLYALTRSFGTNDFNPLPPHGGRRTIGVNAFKDIPISIHSLRMEGDETVQNNYYAGDIFQSTPSAWRETALVLRSILIILFQSTPSAWRETGKTIRRSGRISYFNPLPPHGGRRSILPGDSQAMNHFNPLPPHGGRPCRRTHCRY